MTEEETPEATQRAATRPSGPADERLRAVSIQLHGPSGPSNLQTQDRVVQNRVVPQARANWKLGPSGLGPSGKQELACVPLSRPSGPDQASAPTSQAREAMYRIRWYFFPAEVVELSCCVSEVVVRGYSLQVPTALVGFSVGLLVLVLCPHLFCVSVLLASPIAVFRE